MSPFFGSLELNLSDTYIRWIDISERVKRLLFFIVVRIDVFIIYYIILEL